ncbi:MAG: LVIVD repeat-containing protein [Actinomycetota bacterium]
MKKLLGVALVAVGLVVGAQSGASAHVDKSDNVKLVSTFKYKIDPDNKFFTAGTDLAFSGKYVYAAQQGPETAGIHIIDASGKKPREVGFFKCSASQNDVAVVRPGLLANAYHSGNCGGPGGGVSLIDVRNPKRARVLGAVTNLPGGSHTLTVYPGKPIIYASPGGLANGGGTEQILDVSNPRKPKVAATYLPSRIGCHDLTFSFTKERKLAVCAGLTETQIWDVSDPLAPETIGRIVNPLMFFPHSAAVTDDGRYLVLGDEAFAADDCVGGPLGALWVYDISNPAAPVPMSYYGASRGPAVSSPEVDRGDWCTAHLFNFVPGTYTLVSSWYAAGMNVLDLSDPRMPREIAHYQEDETNYWSAYWYDGRIWANDRERGALDVFEVKGIKEKKGGRG